MQSESALKREKGGPVREEDNILAAGLFRLLLVFAAFMLSAVVIASVSGSDGYLSGTGRSLQMSPAAGYALSFAVILFFLAVLITEAVLLFIRARTPIRGIGLGGGRGSSFLINTIISLAFIFSLLGLYLLLESRHITLRALNGTASPVTANSTSPLQDIFGGSLFSYVGGLVISITIALILALVTLSVLLTMRSFRPVGSDEEQQRTFAESIAQEIPKIRNSEDPRSAILDTYRKMCIFLSGRGAEDRKWWTAREFETRISERFGVRRKTLAELTSLFEEAKYSLHELGEPERERAVSLLEEIRKESSAAGQGG